METIERMMVKSDEIGRYLYGDDMSGLSVEFCVLSVLMLWCDVLFDAIDECFELLMVHNR